MKAYLKFLAVPYFIGAMLHGLDLFDLRLHFLEMLPIWKSWIVFLAVADFVAAVGLWRNHRLGEYAFLTIAILQLVAYIGFSSTFGTQTPLIAFHTTTLLLYFAISLRQKRGWLLTSGAGHSAI